MLKSIVLMLSAALFLVVEGQSPSGTEWCNYCLTQRNGPNYYEDPYDCSKYYQCLGDKTGDGYHNVRAIHMSCPLCTYWDQDKLTCVYESNHCASPARIYQAVPNTCARYYHCSANGVSPKCCNDPGYGFDYYQQACVYNGCSEDCNPTSASSTSSTTSPPTTSYPAIVGDCKLGGWSYKAIPEYPNLYWLVLNGALFQQLSCATLVFDVSKCSCQAPPTTAKPPTQGCLIVHLPITAEANFADVISNNYVDPGTTGLETFSNGELAAYFNGRATSTIEIPRFNNYEWQDKAAISFWYCNYDLTHSVKGIVTNGNCDDKGSVNVWIEGNVLKGGFVTSALGLEEGLIAQTVLNPVYYWHHVVLSYDGAQVTFYVDNQLIGSKTTSGQILRKPAPITIGNAFCDGGKFKGYVDDFRVFKCPLTATEVQDLYTTHTSPY